jgi:hypothetical protein
MQTIQAQQAPARPDDELSTGTEQLTEKGERTQCKHAREIPSSLSLCLREAVKSYTGSLSKQHQWMEQTNHLPARIFCKSEPGGRWWWP